MSGTRPAVLITGAGGYLGERLTRRYVADDAFDVVAAVRTEAAGAASLVERLGDDADRVQVIVADLADDDPFAAVDDALRDRLARIVHGAAVTRFNVERDLARRVNVEGTAKVVALGRTCPNLERLVQLSTVYATGLRAGVIAEELDDGSAGFANDYEWSKWAAEQVVASDGDTLPWAILRVATVVADDTSGRVTQHNAVHETLKLCFHGLLSVLPGDGATPLYFVTGDDTTDAIVTLADPVHPGGVYHLAPERAAALTLSDVLDLVFACFEDDEVFRRRRIMRPLLVDQDSFELLLEGIDAFAGAVVTQALANVAPFARQLYVDKVLDNRRLRSVRVGTVAPDSSALVSVTADHLVREGWSSQRGRKHGAV